jgi:putative ABC transport system permease protein
MLSRSFLLQLLLAAWIMSRWRQTFACRISISWWVFAIAATVAIFIALLRVSFQGVKTTVASP